MLLIFCTKVFFSFLMLACNFLYERLLAIYIGLPYLEIFDSHRIPDSSIGAILRYHRVT